MSLDPNSGASRSRSPSPAPHSTHDRRCSTPGLRPSAPPSRTPSPSVSPAMLPQGLGIQDVDVPWSSIGDSSSEHHHHHHSHHGHDRWRLTGRKGYNALPVTPPSREMSPARTHGRSRSVDVSASGHHHHHHHHSHHHHGSHGSLTLAPPSPSEQPAASNSPPMHGGYGGRKGYNARPELLPFSPVEVSDASPLRNRDHGLGSMGRKGYNSTPRSLSPRSNP